MASCGIPMNQLVAPATPPAFNVQTNYRNDFYSSLQVHDLLMSSPIDLRASYGPKYAAQPGISLQAMAQNPRYNPYIP